jgi:hypothetical protein
MRNPPVIDLESQGLDDLDVAHDRRHYVVAWTDARFLDAPFGVSISDYEHERDFKHAGAAITWARRRIHKGEMLGDVAEITLHYRTSYGSSYANGPYVIRLDGFWRVDSHIDMSYERLVKDKRCPIF